MMQMILNLTRLIIMQFRVIKRLMVGVSMNLKIKMMLKKMFFILTVLVFKKMLYLCTNK